ncbi:MAG: penicillin-binding protein 2 [Bacilli bacterium]|nr:penicillin-binding protein 2 [Bacilli bacterium]
MAKKKITKNYKRTSRKPINKSVRRNLQKISEKIEKRYYVLMGLIILAITILGISLFQTQIMKNDYYKKKVVSLTEKTVYGESSPRGRIYDRNHQLIVTNKPQKVIYYKKKTRVKTSDEIALAYKLSDMISVPFENLNETNLKEFWLKNHSKEAKAKITEEEWKKLEERKIDSNTIEKYKTERITKEELDTYNEKDKKAAYIYYLMNKGYSYQEKIIKNDGVTDSEYALISENISTLEGIGTRLDWERDYLYGDSFRSILGNISSSENGIPKELKNTYLKKGYSLNDRVGISYLEYQYEDLLKGTKNKYRVLADGTYKLIEEGTRGNDIVLSIDMNLQKQVEEVLTQQIIEAKKEPNTEYYNRSFAIITEAKTGEILAMAGKQAIKEGDGYRVVDYTPGIMTSPVVIGSAVKGASQIVGYNTGAVRIGEYRDDSCIKIAATPQKCSWRYLGRVNDVSALALSSNTYQFRTAINVGHGNYAYNKGLKVEESAFDTYRNTFAEFGLGVKTGIDLSTESLGFKGKERKAGLLLDFSIGQYDTYTPIQLSQYIGTIANNGSRLKPTLLKEVYVPTKNGLVDLKSKVNPTVLNKVNTEEKYMTKVKEGFRAVMTYGTGSGYIDPAYNPAGKTGTSESFIDTDGDGKIDTETISNTFVSYAPFDDPKVTFTVISPDISHRLTKSTYSSAVNKRITREISQKYFDIYK